MAETNTEQSVEQGCGNGQWAADTDTVSAGVAEAVERSDGGSEWDRTLQCDGPMDGAALVSEVVEAVQAHVHMSAEQALAMSLWIVNSYAHQAFQISPMLCLASPDKRCGKTTALAVIGMLARNPLAASNISPAGLFRIVDERSPTLLVDEADTFLRTNRELRCILNAGHTRATAKVIRTAGGSHEPQEFNTWCPKAVALIGALPGTLADRSIVVRMRRKAPADSVGRITPATHDELAPQRARIARWSEENRAALMAATPTTPAGLNDRAADNWWPLLAIADLAGGEWPAAARHAAVMLSPTEPDDENLSVALLRDLRTAFADSGRPRLFTEDLLSRLVAMDESPWRGMRGRQKMDPHLLSEMLRPYGVVPQQLRVGSRVKRGYDLADLQDVFARYLPQGCKDRYTATTTAGTTCSDVADACRATAEDGDLHRSFARAAQQVAKLAQRIECNPDCADPRESTLAQAAATVGVTCSRMLERRVRAGDLEAVEEARRLRDCLDGMLQDTAGEKARVVEPAEAGVEEIANNEANVPVPEGEVAHAAV